MSTPHAGRKWWGWGNADQALKGDFLLSPPKLDDIKLRSPRIPLSSLPSSIRSICYDDKFERLLHSRGRSFEDIVLNVSGDFSNPTDLVAFPRTEEEIQELFNFCVSNKFACIPYGGGSSVVAGVEPPQGDEYKGCITIDMKYFDKILEINEESLSVRVQGGIYGPALETELGKHGLTLRHYPQSFEFSTLGGWIATRGGGHFATLWTHVDEFVESVRVVTPQGITETRRLPGSGAGPAEHRHYIGSEGIYGIITEAWIRVLRRPRYRAAANVFFHHPSSRQSFLNGAKCVRILSQSGLFPSNCRLIEGPEAAKAGVHSDSGKGGPPSLLVLAFESADYNLDILMKRALTICEQCGGKSDAYNKKSWTVEGKSGERSGAAGSWGKTFKDGGYLREVFILNGEIVETFETCVTWDKFEHFHNQILTKVGEAIKKYCGDGTITCRFTHIYPDGPAPYYTVSAEGDVKKRLEQWRSIKKVAMETIIENGGTSTHHHAVGRMHMRGGFEQERGALFGQTLAAIKTVHDPSWILNPGVLVDTKLRSRL